MGTRTAEGAALWMAPWPPVPPTLSPAQPHLGGQLFVFHWRRNGNNLRISGASDGEASACYAGDLGLIPGPWGSPGEENGYLLYLHVLSHSVESVCDPMDCSLSGSSAPGTFQARILEWFAISSFRDLPNPGIELESPVSPALAGRFFITALLHTSI